jgi:hypothetical protein
MPAAYQRFIFNGVPYWKDADGVLYVYETSQQPVTPVRLGTVATGLDPGWKETYAARLASYRASATSRRRV